MNAQKCVRAFYQFQSMTNVHMYWCDRSRVYMYQMDLKGLYLCVITNIQGFMCDVNIQGYVYVMRIFKEALGVYV